MKLTAIIATCITACTPLTVTPSDTLTQRDAQLGTAAITGAAFGAGCFVLVANGGLASRSCDDGRSWELIELNVGSANIREVQRIADHFVAVGQHGWLTISADGRSWRSMQLPGRPYLRDVAFNGHTWVAVGDDGFMMRSTDMNIWQNVALDDSTRWVSAAWDGHRFIISGIWESYATSVDGLHWSRRTLEWHAELRCPYGEPDYDCNDIDELRAACNAYYAVIHPTMALWRSNDLRTWHRLPLELPASTGGLWVTRAQGRRIVVAGHAGKAALSNDCGASWQHLSLSTRGLMAAAFSPSTLLIAGMDGIVATLELQ